MGFPHHLRLSIHQSTGEHKISMSLLNTKTGFTTPWHCSVALLADGEWLSAPMGDFQKGTPSKFEIVYETNEDGQQVASYFRERSQSEQEKEKQEMVARVLSAATGNGQKEEIINAGNKVACRCTCVEVHAGGDNENDTTSVSASDNGSARSKGPFTWKYFWM